MPRGDPRTMSSNKKQSQDNEAVKKAEITSRYKFPTLRQNAIDHIGSSNVRQLNESQTRAQRAACEPKLSQTSCSSYAPRQVGGPSRRVSPCSIGCGVQIAGVKSGVLKFFGRTHFQEGLWCGIELDSPEGRHDGSIQGVRYFQCSPDRGVFAPVHKVVVLPEESSLKRSNTFTVHSDEDDEAMDSRKKSRVSPQPERRKKVVGRTLSQQQGPSESSKKKMAVRRPKREKLSSDNFEDTEDVSLGILSPSDMQCGLPSLSTSLVSNFAWTGNSDEEQEGDGNVTTTKSKSLNSSLSAGARNLSHKSRSRHSASSVKTFSLDKEKLRQIEALAASREHPPLELPLPNRPPKVEKALDRTFSANDSLHARTELLLKSSKKKKTHVKKCHALDETVVLGQAEPLVQVSEKAFNETIALKSRSEESAATTMATDAPKSFNQDMLNSTYDLLAEDEKSFQGDDGAGMADDYLNNTVPPCRPSPKDPHYYRHVGTTETCQAGESDESFPGDDGAGMAENCLNITVPPYRDSGEDPAAATKTYWIACTDNAGGRLSDTTFVAANVSKSLNQDLLNNTYDLMENNKSFQGGDGAGMAENCLNNTVPPCRPSPKDPHYYRHVGTTETCQAGESDETFPGDDGAGMAENCLNITVPPYRDSGEDPAAATKTYWIACTDNAGGRLSDTTFVAANVPKSLNQDMFNNTYDLMEDEKSFQGDDGAGMTDDYLSNTVPPCRPSPKDPHYYRHIVTTGTCQIGESDESFPGGDGAGMAENCLNITVPPYRGSGEDPVAATKTCLIACTDDAGDGVSDEEVFLIDSAGQDAQQRTSVDGPVLSYNNDDIAGPDRTPMEAWQQNPYEVEQPSVDEPTPIETIGAKVINQHRSNLKIKLDEMSSSSTSSKVDSLDTGIGSMPSSMVLMANSQDTVDLESSEMFNSACPTATGGPADSDAKSAKHHHHISPISEKEEERSSSLEVDEPEVVHSVKRKGSEGVDAKAPDFKKPHKVMPDKKVGTATKRSELLQRERIVPNTNVPSKLKAMLMQNTRNNNVVSRRKKVVGKWDGIMSQIAKNQKQQQQQQSANFSAKEAKGKVLAGQKQPAVIRSRKTSDSAKSSESCPMNGSNLRHSRSSSKSSLVSASSSCHLPRSDSILSDISNQDENKKSAQSALNKENLVRRSNSVLGDKERKQKREHTGTNLKGMRVKRVSASQDLRVASSSQVSGVAPKERSAKKASTGVGQVNANNNAKNFVNANRAKAKDYRQHGPVRPSATRPYSSSSFHQPDLVKGASEASFDSQQKAREIEILRQRLRYNATAFEALAVAMDYVANRAEGIEAKRLEAEVRDFKNIVAVKEREIEDLRKLSSEAVEYKSNVESVISDCESKIEQLKQLHEEQLERVRATHRSELDNLNSARILDLTQQDSRHELEVSAIHAESKQELRGLEITWQQRLRDSTEEATRRLEADWQRKEERWGETRRSLEDQVRSLQTEIRDQDIIARAKNKGDLQLQSAHKKIEKITAEVDSLKAVLDLKTKEVHQLRNDNVRLEEKVEEFDRINMELKKANALVEDLKEQITAKNNLERKLSAENRKLSHTVERELSEKKRLSLENEELQWKIRQSTSDLSGMLSLSAIEGGSTPTQFFSFSTPSPDCRASLSCSFTEGCPKSLPPFMGRIPLGRRVSDSSEPESPRVLEVVEKTESVAWKIEYQEQQQQQSAYQSPGLKRKLSPQCLRRQQQQPGDSSPGQLRRLNGGANGAKTVVAAAPQFEPLSEDAEGVQDESLTESPSEENDDCSRLTNCPSAPVPVDTGADNDEEETVEIPSSTEVEISTGQKSDKSGENASEEAGQADLPIQTKLPNHDLNATTAAAKIPKNYEEEEGVVKGSGDDDIEGGSLSSSDAESPKLAGSRTDLEDDSSNNDHSPVALSWSDDF